MIDIKIIASGSSGNCYLIKDGDKKVLIDPGIQFMRIQKALDFAVSGMDFVLLSHEHKDHSFAIADIIKLGVKVLTSSGTANALDIAMNAYLSSEVETEVDDWKILPFKTQHDAMEPLGFLIQSPSGSKIFYATDTFYVEYRFTGVTHYLIECNYARDLLDANRNLPGTVKARIITSHFELERVKEFFRHQDLSKTIAIYLLHLSDANSNQERFIREIQEVTGKPVY
jgi:phosphoribosyl 1,2-cyclic phosphodiesterase